MKPYYMKLLAGLPALGIAVETVVHDRTTTLATVDATPGIHIVDHGSLRHPRLLNTGIAYVYPFWNLDPWGIRALSSIAEQAFDVAKVDPDLAAGFVQKLRARLIGARISRYPQAAHVTELPDRCIAVFLQSEQHRAVEETCYLSMRQMLTALLDRDDARAIIVKPHPRDASPQTRRYLARLAERDARIKVVDANIHDMLARAAIAVTINSAVGIEAHLHGVPVVLCGRSDFHHAAVTVADFRDVEVGIARAEAASWPHEQFLYWYFVDQCLNAGRPDLVTAFVHKIEAFTAIR